MNLAGLSRVVERIIKLLQTNRAEIWLLIERELTMLEHWAETGTRDEKLVWEIRKLVTQLKKLDSRNLTPGGRRRVKTNRTRKF